ncbi:UNVERIFIED_CONTAM: hypothetical protein FKN15_018868 [Acipenser sinensis]
MQCRSCDVSRLATMATVEGHQLDGASSMKVAHLLRVQQRFSCAGQRNIGTQGPALFQLEQLLNAEHRVGGFHLHFDLFPVVADKDLHSYRAVGVSVVVAWQHCLQRRVTDLRKEVAVILFCFLQRHCWSAAFTKLGRKTHTRETYFHCFSIDKHSPILINTGGCVVQWLK